jgi:O-antigen/teichoic acid export membrane protein
VHNQLAKLVRHTTVYGLGSALTAIGGFLLIPLYTHVLTTAEYGTLELLNRIADILILVMFMGVRQAYIRFYFDDKDEIWRNSVTTTVVAFALVSSIAIGAIFYPFRSFVLEHVFKNQISDVFLILVLSWVPVEMLIAIGLSHLQINMRSVPYVTINFLRLLLFVLLNVMLLYFYRTGVIGVLIAQIVAASVVAVSFLVYFLRWARGTIRISLLKSLLAFGLPYLPATVFMYMINNADRYFLSVYSSLEAVGIYALASKFGMLGLTLIMDPFNKVWAPFLFENYSTPKGPKLIGKVFMLYTLVSVFVALGIAVLSPVVIPLVSDEAFHSAYRVVPLICLASVFYGMACLADAGILIAKKTHYKPVIFGLASVVTVVGNFVLVPAFGVLGAAIASAVGFGALFIINLLFSNRFYRIPLEVGKFLLIFAAASCTYLLSIYAIDLGEGFAYKSLLALVALTMFPILLWTLGILSDDDKNSIKQLFQR